MVRLFKILLLISGFATAARAGAITPHVNQRDEQSTTDAVYVFQRTYFKGLAERLNAAMKDPEDWTAVDRLLTNSGLKPRVRRSIFSFLSDPWCNALWPSVEEIGMIAKTVGVALEDLVQPDRLSPYASINGPRTKGNVSPRFQGYLDLLPAVGVCTGAFGAAKTK